MCTTSYLQVRAEMEQKEAQLMREVQKSKVRESRMLFVLTNVAKAAYRFAAKSASPMAAGPAQLHSA